jgi:hypothetical protein
MYISRKQEILADKVAIVQYWSYFNEVASSEVTFRKMVARSGRMEWDEIELDGARERDY